MRKFRAPWLQPVRQAEIESHPQRQMQCGKAKPAIVAASAGFPKCRERSDAERAVQFDCPVCADRGADLGRQAHQFFPIGCRLDRQVELEASKSESGGERAGMGRGEKPRKDPQRANKNG